jgi:tetrahydromethanopterin S-methyltransferase subunit F
MFSKAILKSLRDNQFIGKNAVLEFGKEMSRE